ncbi:MAG: hypothetical protein U9O87_02660 [Verrucomicrobiota bacterium]|nr:hypothetical protein [Verrucomicrobiota bacterium]
MNTREAVLAGQSYPANANEIASIFEHYNKIFDEHVKDEDILRLHPRALIEGAFIA